jgi:hypothetical protein
MHERPLAVVANGHADRFHRSRAIRRSVARDIIVHVHAPEAVWAVVAVLGARGRHRDIEAAAAAAEAVRAAAPGMGTAMAGALVARQAETSVNIGQ